MCSPGGAEEQEFRFHSVARKEAPASGPPLGLLEGPLLSLLWLWGLATQPLKVWPLPFPHQPQVAAENTQIPTPILRHSCSFTQCPNPSHKHSHTLTHSFTPTEEQEPALKPMNPISSCTIPLHPFPSPEVYIGFGRDEEGT